MNSRWLLAGGMLVATVLAAALRLPELDLRPLHGDEAVHAVKFDELWQTGTVRYDPHEYHGPTLYYFTLPVRWIRGQQSFADVDELTLRVVPALFGVGVVLLLVLLADGLGGPATLVAALLAAVSPAMSFFSRYTIQEMLLVFFTLAALGCGWRAWHGRHAAWLILGGVSAGMMHATKETCVIAFAAWGFAMLATLAWQGQLAVAVARLRRGSSLRIAIASLLAAVVVSCLFFSGFFTNASGPLDSLLAYRDYFRRGTGGEAGLHDHPWHYYLSMLAYTHLGPGPSWSEALILALAVPGIVFGIAGRRIRGVDVGLARFLAIYGVLMVVVYSAIPYKTPWCLTQFLLPLILLAGIGLVGVLQAVPWRSARGGIVIGFLLAAGSLARQAVAANFRFQVDYRNPYVYAHPLRDTVRLGAWIERLARVSPGGGPFIVRVIEPNPWPLPWYLRRLPYVGYWETPPDDLDADVVVVSQASRDAVVSGLDGTEHESHYGLRPGEVLSVFVRRALWDAFVSAETPPPERVEHP